MMKKVFLTAVAVLALGVFSNNLFAQATATTAPSPAVTSVDLVSTLSRDPDYVAIGLAIRVANLDATLRGAGPYTIFAPSNTAFSNLSAGKLDSLFKNPTALAALLNGHVVSGKYDKAALIKVLGSGAATLTTLDGKVLKLSVSEKKLTLTDSDGNKAHVIAFDMLGTNGVAIGLDAVLTK